MSSFFERLFGKVFARHSNPWSAWSRLLSAPLIYLTIWHRSRGAGALLGAWLVANPVVFPEPEDDEAWGAFRRRPLPTAASAVGQVALLLVCWREYALYYERHRDERG